MAVQSNSGGGGGGFERVSTVGAWGLKKDSDYAIVSQLHDVAEDMSKFAYRLSVVSLFRKGSL